MSLGIVVPAFRPDVEQLSAYVSALNGRLSPETLWIELDDPLPETRERVAEMPAEVNTVESRQGKGAAITRGFERLDTDVLAFADADGATPAGSIKQVVEPVTDGTADLSVGSRRHPDATIRGHQTLARRRLGDGYAWLARRLIDAQLYDYQCGAKAITHDTWARVRERLCEPGFAWDIELIAQTAASGSRIVEVPIEWEDAPGSTVAPLRDGGQMLRGLLVSHHRSRMERGAWVHRLLASGRERPPALIDRSVPEKP